MHRHSAQVLHRSVYAVEPLADYHHDLAEKFLRSRPDAVPSEIPESGEDRQYTILLAGCTSLWRRMYCNADRLHYVHRDKRVLARLRRRASHRSSRRMTAVLAVAGLQPSTLQERAKL
jgi:hypothetical protein